MAISVCLSVCLVPTCLELSFFISLTLSVCLCLSVSNLALSDLNFSHFF